MDSSAFITKKFEHTFVYHNKEAFYDFTVVYKIFNKINMIKNNKSRKTFLFIHSQITVYFVTSDKPNKSFKILRKVVER